MKKHKLGICLIITVFMALSSTACSTETNHTEETPYYSITIDGEKKYYSEEDDTISKLIELTEGYTVAAGESNYQIPDEAAEEVSYYSEAKKAQAESSDYVNRINEMITAYQLLTEISEKTVKDINLASQHGQATATVACEYIISIKNATDEYLEQVQVKKDTKYRRTMTVVFVLENDEWKVSSNSVSEREEVK